MNELNVTEVAGLKRQLVRARKELQLATMGFLFSGIATGYLLRWYLGDQQKLAAASLPLIGFGVAFFGLLGVAVCSGFSRLSEFMRWKYQQGARTTANFQHPISHNGKQ